MAFTRSRVRPPSGPPSFFPRRPKLERAAHADHSTLNRKLPEHPLIVGRCINVVERPVIVHLHLDTLGRDVGWDGEVVPKEFVGAIDQVDDRDAVGTGHLQLLFLY